MTEEQKELLKEKLKNFFDSRLDLLTNSFENHINSIEELKYTFYDTFIIPFRELKEKEEEISKEKDKNEKTEKKTEKKKEDKNIEEKKEPKESLSKTIIVKKDKDKVNNNITSTPTKQNKKREIEFKGKTEVLPKKSRLFSGKTHKPELTISTIPEKPKKKLTTITEANTNKKKEHERSSKTPLNKKEKVKEKEDKKDNKNKKTRVISATAYKPSATKRFTSQKNPIDKKGKPEKKKIEKKKDIKKPDNKAKDKKKQDKEKDKKEKAEELEKKIEKIIVLKDKTINKIPETLKNNNALFNFYLVIKGNYLNKKENYKLILSEPKIYKAFDNNITFLLDDTKKELKSKISELETFLNRYGDLPNIISREFKPSPSALKSLLFVKKEELESLIKKGNIPKEFPKILEILLYMLDIEFDANLSDENLIQFFNSEIIVKTNAKNVHSIVMDYISKNKDMKLTKEKVEKIENIINTDNIIISITDMAKINRILSYLSMLIKDYHDYIILQTSDEIPYYELRNKHKNLQELKMKLSTIENNGIPPKIEEGNKEENKEEVKEEVKEEKKDEIKEESKDIKEEKKDEIKDEKIETKLEDNNEKKEEIEEKKTEEKEEIKTEDSKEKTELPVENNKVEEQTLAKEEN